MKTEMQLTDGRVLEIDVTYSKGGQNFFNGNNERRGYSLHLSPVKIEKHGEFVSKSFVIGGDPKDRGLKSFLLETLRQSPKAMQRAEEIGASRLNRVINEWLSRSGCQLVTPVPPHSIVGYSELPTILLQREAPRPSCSCAGVIADPSAVHAADKCVPASLAIPRAMRLTKEELSRLPAIKSQENNPDPLAVVKFFQPWGGWTWYATEYDGKDEFFGFVVGLENELGYFSLSELSEIRGPMGLTLERDIHWKPTPLSVVRAKHERAQGVR